LQNIAPLSAPGGLNIAAPAPGLGFAPAPVNAPGLVLTPAQITTLGSGDVTSINQLLGQLVGGNTTSEQLASLVNTLVTPPTPTPLPPTSLPPISTPTPTPPVITGGPTPTPTPLPPIVTTPTTFVSRS
jgi:hypothetical protein